jgi:hypothetical protein
MLACAQAVEGRTVRTTMTKVGVYGKQLIEKEVRKDFGGDLAMSNWRRPPKRRVPLRGRFDQPDDNRLVFGPSSPKLTGIWQVAEQGRRSGSKVKRPNRVTGRRPPSSWGATRGKRTWSRATDAIADKGGDLYRRAQRDEVVNAFKKG